MGELRSSAELHAQTSTTAPEASAAPASTPMAETGSLKTSAEIQMAKLGLNGATAQPETPRPMPTVEAAQPELAPEPTQPTAAPLRSAVEIAAAGDSPLYEKAPTPESPIAGYQEMVNSIKQLEAQFALLTQRLIDAERRGNAGENVDDEINTLDQERNEIQAQIVELRLLKDQVKGEIKESVKADQESRRIATAYANNKAEKAKLDDEMRAGEIQLETNGSTMGDADKQRLEARLNEVGNRQSELRREIAAQEAQMGIAERRRIEGDRTLQDLRARINEVDIRLAGADEAGDEAAHGEAEIEKKALIAEINSYLNKGNATAETATATLEAAPAEPVTETTIDTSPATSSPAKAQRNNRFFQSLKERFGMSKDGAAAETLTAHQEAQKREELGFAERELEAYQSALNEYQRLGEEADFLDRRLDEVDERLAAIAEEMKQEGADVAALTTEKNRLVNERETIIANYDANFTRQQELDKTFQDPENIQSLVEERQKTVEAIKAELPEKPEGWWARTSKKLRDRAAAMLQRVGVTPEANGWRGEVARRLRGQEQEAAVTTERQEAQKTDLKGKHVSERRQWLSSFMKKPISRRGLVLGAALLVTAGLAERLSESTGQAAPDKAGGEMRQNAEVSGQSNESTQQLNESAKGTELQINGEDFTPEQRLSIANHIEIAKRSPDADQRLAHIKAITTKMAKMNTMIAQGIQPALTETASLDGASGETWSKLVDMAAEGISSKNHDMVREALRTIENHNIDASKIILGLEKRGADRSQVVRRLNTLGKTGAMLTTGLPKALMGLA